VALSLLFGIFLAKPSPFCLLDEVDAPLDDQNIGRFVRMLNEFKTRTQFIDQHPVGGFQIRLLLTCAAVLLLDGFDTQAIGYVAPVLAKEWGLTKGALGPVFSAGADLKALASGGGGGAPAYPTTW